MVYFNTDRWEHLLHPYSFPMSCMGRGSGTIETSARLHINCPSANGPIEWCSECQSVWSSVWCMGWLNSRTTHVLYSPNECAHSASTVSERHAYTHALTQTHNVIHNALHYAYIHELMEEIPSPCTAPCSMDWGDHHSSLCICPFICGIWQVWLVQWFVCILQKVIKHLKGILCNLLPFAQNCHFHMCTTWLFVAHCATLLLSSPSPPTLEVGRAVVGGGGTKRTAPEGMKVGQVGRGGRSGQQSTKCESIYYGW